VTAGPRGAPAHAVTVRSTSGRMGTDRRDVARGTRGRGANGFGIPRS
jgi:hypothetical protein